MVGEKKKERKKKKEMKCGVCGWWEWIFDGAAVLVQGRLLVF